MFNFSGLVIKLDNLIAEYEQAIIKVKNELDKLEYKNEQTLEQRLIVSDLNRIYLAFSNALNDLYNAKETITKYLNM